MFYTDLHNDTITLMSNIKEDFYSNTLNIDLKSLKKFEKASLFFSIFLNEEKLKSPFKNTMEYINFYYKNINKHNKFIEHNNSYNDLIKTIENNKISSFLSLEGGEAIENNLDNIYKFYEKGVRAITLTWNNENNLGFGALSNIDSGLTDFGISAIKEMEKLNILIDISHLNEKGFINTSDIVENIYASHSNAYEITPSKRNLKDYQIKEIKNHKGIIGINFHGFFLHESGEYNFSHIIKHMDHILNIGGENILAIGGDFDGTNCLCNDLKKVTGINKLFLETKKYFGPDISNKIFTNNYLKFLKNLKN